MIGKRFKCGDAGAGIGALLQAKLNSDPYSIYLRCSIGGNPT